MALSRPPFEYHILSLTMCCGWFSTAKDLLWQSGVVGTVLTLLVYPFYLQLVAVLSQVLTHYGIYSEANLFAVMLTLVHVMVYTIVNGSFGIFDVYGYFQEYKLMRRPYMIPKGSLIARTIAEAVFGRSDWYESSHVFPHNMWCSLDRTTCFRSDCSCFSFQGH
jgi:hypothetical protein